VLLRRPETKGGGRRHDRSPKILSNIRQKVPEKDGYVVIVAGNYDTDFEAWITAPATFGHSA
jgi:hypothetical protein